jgi:hypothetical protein
MTKQLISNIAQAVLYTVHLSKLVVCLTLVLACSSRDLFDVHHSHCYTNLRLAGMEVKILPSLCVTVSVPQFAELSHILTRKNLLPLPATEPVRL